MSGSRDHGRPVYAGKFPERGVLDMSMIMDRSMTALSFLLSLLLVGLDLWVLPG